MGSQRGLYGSTLPALALHAASAPGITAMGVVVRRDRDRWWKLRLGWACGEEGSSGSGGWEAQLH